MATRTTRSTAKSRTEQAAPTETAPPVEGQAPGTEVPTRVSPEEVHAIVEGVETPAAAPTMPELIPPELRTTESITEGALEAVSGTWRTSQTIDAMWSINQVRNAFMHVKGLGWRKIYNGRDGAFQALTFLAAQARQTGKPTSFREESDGMVHEIYLW